jgi:Domain of unknown function (DUF4329)
MRALLAVLLLLSLPVQAQELIGPTPSLIPTAWAALQPLTNKDGCIEYAGVIIREASGAYRYTTPVTGTEDHFTLKVFLYGGERLAGLYHIHPLCAGKKSDEMFSPNDIQTADRLNVSSFIWVGVDDSVREYIPGRSKLVYLPKLQAQASYGTVIGHMKTMLVAIGWNLMGFQNSQSYVLRWN